MSFWEVASFLFDGFKISLLIFAVTLLCGAPLGLPIAFCSMSRFKPLRVASKIFVWIIRGIPLMLQIFIIYYVPSLVFGLEIWRDINVYFTSGNTLSYAGSVIAVLIAFVINYACYFSEIYRGGIESIPQGQYEAGQVLGMTRQQVFFKVILLQVIKRTLPPMGNEFITLVKDTALARIISIYEITYMGESFIKKGLIWPLFYTGAFYLLFNGVLTVVFARLEKKLNYFKG